MEDPPLTLFILYLSTAKSPSHFTIKLYHGGHFENYNSKFVGYKVDYFDFCNVNLMFVFEVRAMVSIAIGRKSAAFDLYFKSPKESMELVGKLETDAETRMMTELISEQVQYVEVFVVLIEPLAVECLSISQPVENLDVIDLDKIVDESQTDSSAGVEDYSSLNEVVQPEVKKLKVKKPGRKPPPKKRCVRLSLIHI